LEGTFKKIRESPSPAGGRRFKATKGTLITIIRIFSLRDGIVMFMLLRHDRRDWMPPATRTSAFIASRKNS